MAVDQTPIIEAKLLAMWRQVLERDDLTPDDDPLQLGATSMQIMSVIGRIADEISIDAPVEAMLDAVAISEQAAALSLAL